VGVLSALLLLLLLVLFLCGILLNNSSPSLPTLVSAYSMVLLSCQQLKHWTAPAERYYLSCVCDILLRRRLLLCKALTAIP